MTSFTQPVMSTTDLIRDCQKAAKEKRWPVAIKLASTALQECDGAPSHSRVTILDTRVALYIRMNEVDSALKDAKAMIRHDRNDGRGYIRCGQIERMRGNCSAATNFYRHGLKHVPTSSPYVQLLTKEMRAVQEQIRLETMSSKPIDPMEVLPLEIVQDILSFVSYQQHVRLLRVCRAWNRILRSLRPLIDTLSFPLARKTITPKMLLAALRRLKSPTAVYANRLDDAASSILSNRLRDGQNFQSLSILEVQSKIPPEILPFSKYDLKSVKFGPSTVIRTQILFDIFDQCPGLESAHFARVRADSPARPQIGRDRILQSKALQYLYLHAPGERLDMVSTTSLIPARHRHVLTASQARFLSGVPSLRYLSFSGSFGVSLPSLPSQHVLDLRYMSGLEILEISESMLPRLYLPASLRELNISETECMFEDLPEPNPTKLPNLERLTIWHCREPPWSIFSNSRETKPEMLSDLTVNIDQRSQPMFTTMMESGWLSGVRQLRLAGSALDNSYGNQLLPCLRSIEDLCLERTAINGAFIADLLNASNLTPGKLRKITLIDCPLVSSDVVPWAKARGVEISLTRSKLEYNGRRLRDAH